MGLRLAAGLPKARVARAEGVDETVLDRLLGDAEFVALRGEFARLMAMGHDERMKFLRDQAFFVLHMAIDAGDLRAASFFVTEEARGRDPVDTLITRFWQRATREARKAAPPPEPPPPQDSTPAPVSTPACLPRGPAGPGRPAAPSALPGERFRRRGVDVLTLQFQDELIVRAGAEPWPAGLPVAAEAACAHKPGPAPFEPPGACLQPCWTVPTLRRRRSFGKPALLTRHVTDAPGPIGVDPGLWTGSSGRPTVARMTGSLSGAVHDGPGDRWRFEPAARVCHVNALLGPMLPLGP